jgi:PAS domain S-box-containing protein
VCLNIGLGYGESLVDARNYSLDARFEPLHAALVHPEDLGRTYEAWAQAMDGKPVLRFENRYRCKFGGWRWLSWVAVPEEGKVHCNVRDVTVEKAQAEELATQRLERDRLWETSPDLLLGLTVDGVIKRVNPAWSIVLGYQPQELLGRRIDDFVVPEDRGLAQKALKDAAMEPLPVLESRHMAKDGSLRWISWVASRSEGVIYATGRHITAVKQAEAALARSEDVLRQAHKMEAVGQLTGGLAHDFNNLLAGITGSLELMRIRITQGRMTDIERYLDTAHGAARRASSLTQRLLAFPGAKHLIQRSRTRID